MSTGPQRYSQTLQGISGHCQTASTVSVEFDPETEMIVWTWVLQARGVPDCVVLVENLDDAFQEYRVARTLCNMQRGNVPVRVCNPHPFFIEIPQRCPVATVSQVDPQYVRTGADVVQQAFGPTEVETHIKLS